MQHQTRGLRHLTALAANRIRFRRIHAVLCAGTCALLTVFLLTTCSEDEPLAPEKDNKAPAVEIQSPVDNGADPTEILARPTLVVTLTDPDDRAANLSFRWTFVSTIPFGEDWAATEDSVLSNPDSLDWSGWNSYAPSDTGMTIMVADSLDFGFYVLAVQARDPDRARSELDDDSMRRVVVGDGHNDAPVVTIHSPVRTTPDPLDISSQPTVRFEITDSDDLESHLSYRWAFVQTWPHGQDWDATENEIRTHPEDVLWSVWNAWTPEGDGTMSVTVPALANAPYVLTVQAKDRSARRSNIDAGSLRRVRVCAAANYVPGAYILIPVRNGLNPASVPPITTFVFSAGDPDNDREDLSVRWAMVNINEFDENWNDAIDYLRKDPAVLAQYGKTEADAEAEWTAWVPYVPNHMSVTTAPLDFGGYIFAVQAKDPCDAFLEELDEVRNVRRIRVSNRSTGPVLTVRNPHVGPVTSVVCDPPVVIAGILSSVPMRFEWDASARPYGGVVEGYRYGWDILDLDDDSQWEIDFTPFVGEGEVAAAPPRAFASGTHTFHVEVKDNSGFCSRATIKLNIIPYAPTRDLLLVDDFPADHTPGAGWDDPIGNGFAPSDAEHDQFWLDMLDNVEGFDPGFDVIEVSGNTPIPLTTLANYKNIIWSVYSAVGQQVDVPLLYEYTRYRSKDDPAPAGVREPNPLALFMEAGGHILISGHHPLTATINQTFFTVAPRFPFMFLYDYEGDQERRPRIDEPSGDESFAYVHLSLQTSDFAIPTASTWRNNILECPVEDMRPITPRSIIDDGMRDAIPMAPGFLPLTLRMETAGPGKAYAPDRRSYEAEVYNPMYFYSICRFPGPPRSSFEPIYGLGCPNTSSVNYNQPVAFWTSAFADRVADGGGGVAARSALFGFPLVYFDPAQVKPGLEYIFFNEWLLSRTP